jgi:hypothetical protein
LAGLYLSAFQPKKIKANPLVQEFYKQIPEIPEICHEGLISVSSAGAVEVASNKFVEFEYKDPNIKVLRL